MFTSSFNACLMCFIIHIYCKARLLRTVLELMSAGTVEVDITSPAGENTVQSGHGPNTFFNIAVDTGCKSAIECYDSQSASGTSTLVLE